MTGKLIGVIVPKDPVDSRKPFTVLIEIGAPVPLAQPVSAEELVHIMNRIANKLTPELELEIRT